VTKSKDDKGFGEQYTSEFMKILISEIIPALKSHKIPVSNDTKRAFMADDAEESEKPCSNAFFRVHATLINHLILY